MRTDLQSVQWTSFVAPTPAWACVVVGTPDQLARFLDTTPEGDLLVRTVTGMKCATKDTLLNEWASVLEFPGYFGQNWDALIDCITDMSWLPASSYIVAITDLEAVLPEESEFRVFVEVLQASAQDGVRAGWPADVSERHGLLTFVFQAESYDAAWAKFLPLNTDIPFYRLP